MAAMSNCPDYVWREIEPEEILSTPQAANESIISMLSNANWMHKKKDNSKKHNNFFTIFFHDESVSFAVRDYLWSCDLSNKRDIFMYSNALNLSSGE